MHVRNPSNDCISYASFIGTWLGLSLTQQCIFTLVHKVCSHRRHWTIRISFLCSRVLQLCCCQTKLWGLRACSPDVGLGVRPLRLIRLIRGSNLAGWHWTLHFMRLSSENSQDGWMLHSPEQLRACLLLQHTDMNAWVEWGSDYGIVCLF